MLGHFIEIVIKNFLKIHFQGNQLLIKSLMLIIKFQVKKGIGRGLLLGVMVQNTIQMTTIQRLKE